MESDIYKLLCQSSLFFGLNEKELKTLIENIFYQIKKYNPEEIIAYSGDNCDRLMIVLEGTVKAEMTDFSGKTIKIEDISAPGPLASAFLFGQNNRFPVNISANGQVKILSLPKESVIKLFQTNTIFLTNYLNSISSRTQFLSQKIRFLTFKTIKEKIALYILQLASNNLNRITISSSHQDLADLFGVTRPSLSRALGDMEKEKLIKIEKKDIIILDRDRLNKMIS
jgi:CRP-like cAMP-binding protein